MSYIICTQIPLLWNGTVWISWHNLRKQMQVHIILHYLGPNLAWHSIICTLQKLESTTATTTMPGAPRISTFRHTLKQEVTFKAIPPGQKLADSTHVHGKKIPLSHYNGWLIGIRLWMMIITIFPISFSLHSHLEVSQKKGI